MPCYICFGGWSLALGLPKNTGCGCNHVVHLECMKKFAMKASPPSPMRFAVCSVCHRRFSGKFAIRMCKLSTHMNGPPMFRAQAMTNYGIALSKCNQDKDALRAFQTAELCGKVLPLSSRIPILYNLGNCLSRMGKHNDAQAALTVASQHAAVVRIHTMIPLILCHRQTLSAMEWAQLLDDISVLPLNHSARNLVMSVFEPHNNSEV